MKIRPYLTFSGNCNAAIELYTRAFDAKIDRIMRFSDMPPNPHFQIPEDYLNCVVQCTLIIGDEFIRLSDCGPGAKLNDPDSERISLAIEASVDEVKHAFDVITEEGEVGMPLAETFYSPCAGVCFDKFGVMWNLVGQK